jgi:hypothetical protein
MNFYPKAILYILRSFYHKSSQQARFLLEKAQLDFAEELGDNIGVLYPKM